MPNPMDYCGATPGTPRPPLTREPLGTSGELSPGPDHLRPEVPEERAELERLGYLSSSDNPESVKVLGVMDDSDWGKSPPPIFEETPSDSGILSRLF